MWLVTNDGKGKSVTFHRQGWASTASGFINSRVALLLKFHLMLEHKVNQTLINVQINKINTRICTECITFICDNDFLSQSI